MAYNVSNRYREKIYSGDSVYNCDLRINGVQVPYTQISSIKISNPIIDTNSSVFYVGTFISQSLTIKFRNLDELDIKSGNEVYLEIGQEVDGENEIVPIGYFLIDDLAENYTTSCEITCLDYAVKFKPNIDYSSIFEEDKMVAIDDLLQFICDYYGVELGDYPDTNGDVRIGTYDNSVSGKAYISYIAEIKGCNAKMGRDGKLYLIPLKREPAVTLNALESKSWQVSEEYHITRVLYEDAIRKFEAGEDTANTLNIRTENPYIIGQDVIDNIFEVLDGFRVYSLKCEYYGDISLDSWDVIRYQLGVDGNNNPIYYDTLNDNNLVYEMTIMSTNETKIPTTQQNEMVNIIGGNDTATKLRIMRTEINQQTGNISMLTAETTSIKDNLNNNYYDITKTNELIQNAETGVTNTFSEAGGNNIFKNTGLWFKGDESNTQYLQPSQNLYPSNETYLIATASYEFWSGFAEKKSNDKAVSGNSIILQTGKFKQEQQVPNGEYSISFTYKKLIELATATVKINDNVYNLDSLEYKQFYTGEKDTEGNYIVFPIEVSFGVISIEFETDTNNSVEVYDLMCNKGTVKLAWSQNQNETTTNTVNISEGITISSSKKESKFKADADGIRIINENTKEETTEFTDKGTITNELTVRKKAMITNMLIQEVDDQTWITRM